MDSKHTQSVQFATKLVLSVKTKGSSVFELTWGPGMKDLRKKQSQVCWQTQRNVSNVNTHLI